MYMYQYMYGHGCLLKYAQALSCGLGPSSGDPLEPPHNPATKRLASSTPDLLPGPVGGRVTHQGTLDCTPAPCMARLLCDLVPFPEIVSPEGGGLHIVGAP